MNRKGFSKKQQGAGGGRQSLKDEGSAASAHPFADGVHVRVHFKNGHSGEYSADALRHNAPFDLNDVVSIEKI